MAVMVDLIRWSRTDAGPSAFEVLNEKKIHIAGSPRTYEVLINSKIRNKTMMHTHNNLI